MDIIIGILVLLITLCLISYIWYQVHVKQLIAMTTPKNKVIADHTITPLCVSRGGECNNINSWTCRIAISITKDTTTLQMHRDAPNRWDRWTYRTSSPRIGQATPLQRRRSLKPWFCFLLIDLQKNYEPLDLVRLCQRAVIYPSRKLELTTWYLGVCYFGSRLLFQCFLNLSWLMT